jgi:hypothetical protein
MGQYAPTGRSGGMLAWVIRNDFITRYLNGSATRRIDNKEVDPCYAFHLTRDVDCLSYATCLAQ